jgi:hypothetical protein
VRIPFVLTFALSVATSAFAADSTGIPECDSLLKRYEECSVELPPTKRRAAQKEVLDASVSLRSQANDTKKRADLERYCTNTFTEMKTKSNIKECMSK